MRHRLFAIALLIALWTVPMLAQQKRVLTRDDLGPPTVITLPNPQYNPSVNGEAPWNGYGVAIKELPTGERWLFVTSWKPQVIHRYRLPANLTGSATFLDVVGYIPPPGGHKIYGLFYDRPSDRLCISSGSQYDTNADTASTLACAPFDPATGKLRLKADGTTDVKYWKFADASIPCRTPIPTDTNLSTDRVAFTSHTLVNGDYATVTFASGTIRNLYVHKWSATSISLHTTYAEAIAVTPTAWLDLTEPITAIRSCKLVSDRYTQGSITSVPDELAPVWGGHYLVGPGGYYSIVTSTSRGPVAFVFDLPAQEYIGAIEARPLVYYPNSGTCAAFANRDPNYGQVGFGWDDCPQKGTDNAALFGSGKWPPGMTIDAPGIPIVLPDRQGVLWLVNSPWGLLWYGDNYNNNWPLYVEGPNVAPIATDTTANTLTFSSSPWPTGTLVSARAGKYTVANSPTGLVIWGRYYVREDAPHVYTLHTTQAGANDPADPPIDLKAAVTFSLYQASIAAATGGTPAALNAQGWRHALYIYRVEDLTAVRNGLKRPWEIQPVSIQNLDLPTVTYPYSGQPEVARRDLFGAAWLNSAHAYIVGVRDNVTNGVRRLIVFPVGAPARRPSQPLNPRIEGVN